MLQLNKPMAQSNKAMVQQNKTMAQLKQTETKSKQKTEKPKIEMNQTERKKRHHITAVTRNCQAWDLSKLVIVESKFWLYL